MSVCVRVRVRVCVRVRACVYNCVYVCACVASHTCDLGHLVRPPEYESTPRISVRMDACMHACYTHICVCMYGRAHSLCAGADVAGGGAEDWPAHDDNAILLAAIAVTIYSPTILTAFGLARLLPATPFTQRVNDVAVSALNGFDPLLATPISLHHVVRFYRKRKRYSPEHMLAIAKTYAAKAMRRIS